MTKLGGRGVKMTKIRGGTKLARAENRCAHAKKGGFDDILGTLMDHRGKSCFSALGELNSSGIGFSGGASIGMPSENKFLPKLYKG